MWKFLLMFILLSGKSTIDAACQSCLLIPAYNHRKSSAAVWGHLSSGIRQSTRIADWKKLAIYKLSQKPSLAVAALGASCFLSLAMSPQGRNVWLPSTSWKAEDGFGMPDNEESDASKQKTGKTEDPVSTGMVAALGFYKGFISPLLPPACRFVPTCSQYGVQAIKEFGPGKGSILIAWRLMRCSPIGGKGFDPPRWPPVGYTYGSW